MSARHNARGFALPEVLIAAAIAAAVMAASASALSTSLRGARITSETADSVQQAENIAARLKAGLPINDLIDDDWEVIREPYEASKNTLRTHYLEMIEVTHKETPALTFKVYVVKEIRS